MRRVVGQKSLYTDCADWTDYTDKVNRRWECEVFSFARRSLTAPEQWSY